MGNLSHWFGRGIGQEMGSNGDAEKDCSSYDGSRRESGKTAQEVSTSASAPQLYTYTEKE